MPSARWWLQSGRCRWRRAAASCRASQAAGYWFTPPIHVRADRRANDRGAFVLRRRFTPSPIDVRTIGALLIGVADSRRAIRIARRSGRGRRISRERCQRPTRRDRVWRRHHRASAGARGDLGRSRLRRLRCRRRQMRPRHRVGPPLSPEGRVGSNVSPPRRLLPTLVRRRRPSPPCRRRTWTLECCLWDRAAGWSARWLTPR